MSTRTGSGERSTSAAKVASVTVTGAAVGERCLAASADGLLAAPDLLDRQAVGGSARRASHQADSSHGPPRFVSSMSPPLGGRGQDPRPSPARRRGPGSARCARSAAATSTTIRIEDGVGVPGEHVPHAFCRFGFELTRAPPRVAKVDADVSRIRAGRDGGLDRLAPRQQIDAVEDVARAAGEADARSSTIGRVFSTGPPRNAWPALASVGVRCGNTRATVTSLRRLTTRPTAPSLLKSASRMTALPKFGSGSRRAATSSLPPASALTAAWCRRSPGRSPCGAAGASAACRRCSARRGTRRPMRTAPPFRDSRSGGQPPSTRLDLKST